MPTNMPTLERPKMMRRGGGGGDFLRILLAILLPPLGVFLEVGLSKHFLINVVLTVLGYIPGIIHAVWVITHFH